MSELAEPRTGDLLNDYALLRDACGLYFPADVPLIFGGEDRKGWLQGQVTNDLRELTVGTSRAGCFCAPTGQMIAAIGLWAMDDAIIGVTDLATAPDVSRRVEQMVVIEDVTLKHASDEIVLATVQGPTATARLSEFMDLPTLDAGWTEAEGETFRVARNDRTGMGGWDLWVPKANEKLLRVLRRAISEVGPAAIEIARLEAGIPRWGVDMGPKTLPPEVGQAFELRHVSYKKGCYTGQEVLMRMHSRGHANRSWMALVADSPIPAGAAVSHRSRPDAGVVTSAADSPDYGFIAGAMLRTEAARARETVTVETPDGPIEATVYEMPILRLDG